jgi:hypothetical protein
MVGLAGGLSITKAVCGLIIVPCTGLDRPDYQKLAFYGSVE